MIRKKILSVKKTCILIISILLFSIMIPALATAGADTDTHVKLNTNGPSENTDGMETTLTNISFRPFNPNSQSVSKVELNKTYMDEIRSGLQGISANFWKGRWAGSAGEAQSAQFLQGQLAPYVTTSEIMDYNFNLAEINDPSDVNLSIDFGQGSETIPLHEYFPSYGNSNKEFNLILDDAVVHLAPDWAYSGPRVHRFQPIDKKHVVLLEMDKVNQNMSLLYQTSGDYASTIVAGYLSISTNVDAFLIADYHNNTHFCVPAENLKPCFNINGSLGSRIRNKLESSGDRSVTVDMRLITQNQPLTGYNVMGRIDCSDSDEYILIGAHHDSMWTQGAADDSGTVSSVMGLAKYFNENIENGYYKSIDKTFKYDLVFVGFGGEERGCLGSKNWVNSYDISKLKGAITPGALGYIAGDGFQNSDLNLNVRSLTQIEPELESVILSYPYSGYGNIEIKTGYGDQNYMMGAVDIGSIISATEQIDNMFAIDKGHYTTATHWYHRAGGPNHTYGDVESIMDGNDIVQSAGLIAEMVEHMALADSCFLEDTKIEMTDGSLKNIQDIEIGDIVKSFDTENQEWKTGEVIDVFHHTPEEMTDYYLVINDDLRVTPNHPFYVNNKWINAGDLQLDDVLSGNMIASIDKIYQRVPTYNFEVAPYHTYNVVWGENTVSLVHNQAAPLGKPVAIIPNPSGDKEKGATSGPSEAPQPEIQINVNYDETGNIMPSRLFFPTLPIITPSTSPTSISPLPTLNPYTGGTSTQQQTSTLSLVLLVKNLIVKNYQRKTADASANPTDTDIEPTTTAEPVDSIIENSETEIKIVSEQESIESTEDKQEVIEDTTETNIAPTTSPSPIPPSGNTGSSVLDNKPTIISNSISESEPTDIPPEEPIVAEESEQSNNQITTKTNSAVEQISSSINAEPIIVPEESEPASIPTETTQVETSTQTDDNSVIVKETYVATKTYIALN